MSKKKKIIIAVVCATIIVAGIVTGIILATLKRYDISTTYGAEYRDYNKMTEITLDSNYYIGSNTFLDGGLIKVEDRNLASNNEGYYSFKDNKMVIPAEYSVGNNLFKMNIESTSGEISSTIYKSTKNSGEIMFLNNNGENIGLSEYDSEKGVTYAKIKERNINLKNKKSIIKAKAKNSFNTKEIEVASINFESNLYYKNKYNYEIWSIEDKSGNKYYNIYSVSNGKRHLIQTLNNIGLTTTKDITDNITDNIIILKDGSIRFAVYTKLSTDQNYNTTTTNLKVYDINFEEQNNFNLTINYENICGRFMAGNSLFVQEKIPSNEKKYDFTESEYGLTQYYKLITHKINFKSGKLSKVNFNYIVNSSKLVNLETTVIHARKIKSKILENETTYLLNERLQCKEIGYTIDKLFKVNNKRYLVESGEELIIIDKRFNVESYIGKFNDYFTTNSSILVRIDDFTYVLSHDGLVIKKYKSKNIVNILDNQYYLVKEEVTKEDGIYTEHYLENCGKRISTPVYSIKDGSNTYEYNDKEYVAYYDTVYNGTNPTDIHIITRVSFDGHYYTYEFYNMNGKLLRLRCLVTSTTKSLQLCYNDNDMVILYFEDGTKGHYFKITA